MKPVLAALAATLVVSSPALADDCNALLGSYMTWAQGHNQAVFVTLTTQAGDGTVLNITDELMSYVPPACSGLMCRLASFRAENVRAYGNWSCVYDVVPGGFPFCLNPFNSGLDRATISVSKGTLATYAITVTGKSPGMPSGSFTATALTCKNGLMYATGSGSSAPLFTFSFRKGYAGTDTPH